MIHGRDSQPYPCFATPAEMRLAECKAAISLTLRELVMFRERARQRPEMWLEAWRVEYFDAMQAHLVALRRNREALADYCRRWRVFRESEHEARRYQNGEAAE